ncbi:hypothetical protein H9L13_05045 [Sphingomonas lutea]|uniref:Uncharacterized protein n=1 Tax=Sphingomonas lutea TaxID=1045317 RepID=A0A7G9SK69_9SPHN|nr:hypothetical protein [Sphingomonas lutea]QNN68244.1 hypothetical protein H9L13_05045 [Sphingomonas lutea]
MKSIPILDEPPEEPCDDGYCLPLDDWNEMADLAEHLAILDAQYMPRQRIRTFLEEGAISSTTKVL